MIWKSRRRGPPSAALSAALPWSGYPWRNHQYWHCNGSWHSALQVVNNLKAHTAQQGLGQALRALSVRTLADSTNSTPRCVNSATVASTSAHCPGRCGAGLRRLPRPARWRQVRSTVCKSATLRGHGLRRIRPLGKMPKRCCCWQVGKSEQLAVKLGPVGSALVADVLHHAKKVQPGHRLPGCCSTPGIGVKSTS
jgi:hypothetical protein